MASFVQRVVCDSYGAGAPAALTFPALRPPEWTVTFCKSLNNLPLRFICCRCFHAVKDAHNYCGPPGSSTPPSLEQVKSRVGSAFPGWRCAAGTCCFLSACVVFSFPPLQADYADDWTLEQKHEGLDCLHSQDSANLPGKWGVHDFQIYPPGFSEMCFWNWK